MICPNCGAQNRPTAKFCSQCRTALTAAASSPSASAFPAVTPSALPSAYPIDSHAISPTTFGGSGLNVLSSEERKHILDQEISKYQRQGWRLLNRTDTTAQLAFETKASCLVAIILALLLIVPAVLYLMFYKGTKNLFLEVDEQGQIKATPS
ncbi:MAG: hypothetical protein B6D41_22120 [Chloroflexi bacterium UTCFX4]|jgi:hypothetical protein|nr:MAG: hypothetical protein B6D41_22120 [Chloroflexi bacterium UTCFX4]